MAQKRLTAVGRVAASVSQIFSKSALSAFPSVAWDCRTPRAIPIEQRAESEVTEIQGVRIAPSGIAVRNPAFDVTPHAYVAAIITERGIATAPYEESLRWLKEK